MRCPRGGQSPVEVVAKSANDFVIIQRNCDCDLVELFQKWPDKWKAFRHNVKSMIHAEAYGGSVVLGVPTEPPTTATDMQKLWDEWKKQNGFKKWLDENLDKEPKKDFPFDV